MTELQFGMSTAPGAGRQVNQDAVGAAPERAVWLVADGMGGHAGAEVASSLARDAVLQAVREGADLIAAIERANHAVLRAAEQMPRYTGMGTTIAALRLSGPDGMAAWVGDSRIYRLRCGRLDQITRDHSMVQSLVDRGTISPQEAAVHPRRNVLLRALGLEQPTVDSVSVSVQPGDQWLLCSDGVTGVLDDDCIAAALTQAPDAQAAAALLTGLVTERLGHDDASAIVVRLAPA